MNAVLLARAGPTIKSRLRLAADTETMETIWRDAERGRAPLPRRGLPRTRSNLKKLNLSGSAGAACLADQLMSTASWNGL